MNTKKESGNNGEVSPIQLIWRYSRPLWKALAVLIVNFFIAGWLAALQPLIMAPILEIVISGNNIIEIDPAAASLKLSEVDLNNLGQYVLLRLGISSLPIWNVVVVLAVAYVIVSIVMYLLNYLNYLLSIHIRVKSRIGLQKDLFSHLYDLSLDYFNNQRTGEILSWMENDTRATMNSIVIIAKNVVVAPIMILFYGYLLVRTDARLTFIIFIAALVQYGIGRFASNPIRKITRNQQETIATSSAYLQEVFTNARLVKAFVAEKFEQSRFGFTLDKVKRANFLFGAYKHVEEPVINIINTLTNTAILFLVVSGLLSGDLSASGFFLYLYIGRAILGPINQLALTYVNYQRMLAAAEKITELFSLVPAVTDGDLICNSFNHSISLKKVSFRYLDKNEDDERVERVLSDISMEIKKGEVVALVGPSGAGKTTLTDLLLRFYDPQEGHIFLDDNNIKDLEIASFRQLFGSVSQESLLFNATIAENIAYARPDIPRDAIMEAAKVANAHEFIMQMPQGYDTEIGDQGVLLSGGQRQRIAIARAVVRDPQILILDEATSSLDSVSERLVQEAIDRVIQNSTAVVIAHRLSTVRNADKIVVLDEGRIEDIGTHEELMIRCSLYQNLAKTQFEGSK